MKDAPTHLSRPAGERTPASVSLEADARSVEKIDPDTLDVQSSDGRALTRLLDQLGSGRAVVDFVARSGEGRGSVRVVRDAESGAIIACGAYHLTHARYLSDGAGMAPESTRPELDTAYIYGVVADEAYRGRRLAPAIVAQLIADVRAAGIGCIQLHCADFRVEAQSMYRRIGFRDIGRCAKPDGSETRVFELMLEMR
jgi:ribosomal protein S18 acetylase RimI-like enzyme